MRLVLSGRLTACFGSVTAQSRSNWSVSQFTHPLQEQPPEYFRVDRVGTDQDCQKV